jgi:hypothetical protein
VTTIKRREKEIELRCTLIIFSHWGKNGFVRDPRWSKENDVTIMNISQNHLYELTMHIVSANGISFEPWTCFEFITFTQLELGRKHHPHPHNVL